MRDELQKVLESFNQLGIDQQIDYEKFYLYSIISNSTAIEGSTLTEVENRVLFDDGIASRRPMSELLMNLDLKKAYETGFKMADDHEAFSVDMLCYLSSLVMKNTGGIYKAIPGEFSSANGDLRLLNASSGYGGNSYMAWQKVPGRLAELCHWMNDSRLNTVPNDAFSIYKLSFEAHYQLVYIHPWADGNGRMGRLVMNMIQHEFGLVSSSLDSKYKSEYLACLAETRTKKDSSIFVDFMMEHHISALRKQIQEHEKSLVE